MPQSHAPGGELERLARSLDATASFAEAVELVATWAREFTKAASVTLRIGQDASADEAWLPLCMHAGASEPLLRDEAVVRLGSCACGQVAGGGAGPQSFFTETGSFSWGSMQTLAADFTPEELQGLRGRCVAEGFESIAVVPLLDGPECLGVLHIADHETHRFTDLLPALEQAGRIAGQTFTRHERQGAEPLARRYLQAALLPTDPPHVDGLDVGVSFVTASAFSQMGGDFYEVVPLGDGRVFLFVGDYAGRGLEAAGMANEARRVLAGQAARGLGPAEVLERANDTLSARGDGHMYVTAAAVLLDPRDGEMRTALAGHPPPVVLTNGEGLPLSELTAPFGRPLGLETAAGYREARHRLGPGEILILFTDGVTEARRDGAFFGTDGIEVACRESNQDLTGLANTVCGMSTSFHDPGLPPDDRLVLAVRLA